MFRVSAHGGARVAALAARTALCTDGVQAPSLSAGLCGQYEAQRPSRSETALPRAGAGLVSAGSAAGPAREEGPRTPSSALSLLSRGTQGGCDPEEATGVRRHISQAAASGMLRLGLRNSISKPSMPLPRPITSRSGAFPGLRHPRPPMKQQSFISLFRPPRNPCWEEQSSTVRLACTWREDSGCGWAGQSLPLSLTGTKSEGAFSEDSAACRDYAKVTPETQECSRGRGKAASLNVRKHQYKVDHKVTVGLEGPRPGRLSGSSSSGARIAACAAYEGDGN